MLFFSSLFFSVALLCFAFLCFTALLCNSVAEGMLHICLCSPSLSLFLPAEAFSDRRCCCCPGSCVCFVLNFFSLMRMRDA
ncbi:hypothetical protein F5Y17DRAFT_387997 [Xylariaceae sp. FL0594]|nr:hypothetical protein F5Y17DRAFT_387997 [Xylariaceae sp. FL0594]